MKREDGACQPGARHLEPEQQPPEEQRGQDVQQDVLHVVGSRPELPELIIQPERRARERIILLQGGGLEPDQAQTGGVLKQR